MGGGEESHLGSHVKNRHIRRKVLRARRTIKAWKSLLSFGRQLLPCVIRKCVRACVRERERKRERKREREKQREKEKENSVCVCLFWLGGGCVGRGV